jgi:predicted nucleic acid-binding protein
MNTKLTLNLDTEIISEAKTYAKRHKVSLSKLIENYLNSLTRESKKQSSVSALVESLTGIIPNDFDERKEYRDHIDKKYS